MGSFSWLKADKLTRIENIVEGESFKFLIPKEFGGGFIKDKYQGYGQLGTKEDGEPKYDMYELLAFWNHEQVNSSIKEFDILAKKLIYDGEFPKLKERDEYTKHNGLLGVDIGCYDEEIDKLKYPLKLVSPSYKGTYEDLDTPSYGDPNQGFFRSYRKINN